MKHRKENHKPALHDETREANASKRAYEKGHLLPIRYIMNYRVVPAYGGLTLLLLIACAALMERDEVQYLPFFIVTMCVIAMLTTALLMFSSVVSKKEIDFALSCYDLNYADLPSLEIYDFPADDHIFRFDQNGMYIDDELFWYNHLYIRVEAARDQFFVSVYIAFYIDEDNYCKIPLSAKSIKMIYDLQIPLSNPEVLTCLLDNPRKAFEKIYKRGSL